MKRSSETLDQIQEEESVRRKKLESGQIRLVRESVPHGRKAKKAKAEQKTGEDLVGEVPVEN